MEPVHQRFVGRHDELEAHRVAALVRVRRARERPVRALDDRDGGTCGYAEDIVRLERRLLTCGLVAKLESSNEL